MSEFKHKENTGSLFKNDKREKETSPNMKGSANIDGKEYWMSAWTKDGQKGKFLSLSFQSKTGWQKTKTPLREDMDDEIPL